MSVSRKSSRHLYPRLYKMMPILPQPQPEDPQQRYARHASTHPWSIASMPSFGRRSQLGSSCSSSAPRASSAQAAIAASRCCLYRTSISGGQASRWYGSTRMQTSTLHRARPRATFTACPCALCWERGLLNSIPSCSRHRCSPRSSSTWVHEISTHRRLRTSMRMPCRYSHPTQRRR